MERVKQHYVKNLKTEINEKAFVEAVLKDIDVVTASKGLSRPYLSMVYRTNTMSDFNAGKLYEWSQDPPMALEFLGIDDKRQTSLCAARSGVIRSYTNPWWDTNTPPLHYRCRSTIRAIYEDEYNELMGAGKISKKDIQKAPKIEKITSGFGHKPFVENSHFWKYTPAQQMRVAKYMIQDELNGVVGRTICKDFGNIQKGLTNISRKKGKIRYSEGARREKEFKANFEMSCNLADEYDLYIELTESPHIEGNTKFDAWINGVEKWELKQFGTQSMNTVKGQLITAKTQAQNVYIQITDEFNKDVVVQSLFRQYERHSSQIIIEHNKTFLRTTSKSWTSREALLELLTSIFK